MNKKLLTAAIGAAMIAGPLAAQAELKISGSIAGELTSNDGPGVVFGDSGRSRVQFDAKNEGSYARFAFDLRPVFQNSSPAARDAYLGLKGDWGSMQAGRMAGAVKNIEGDAYITTFLELRNNAVKGGAATINAVKQGYGSSGFVSNLIQYANKSGDVSYKIQYDVTDNGAKNGDLAVGVKAKLAGANVFLGWNNEGGVTGEGFYKLGGAMKFGDIKAKLYYENDNNGGTGTSRFVLGGEMGLGGGASVDVTYGDKGADGTNAYTRVAYMKKMNKKTRFFVGYVSNGAAKSGSTANTATYGGGVRVDL